MEHAEINFLDIEINEEYEKHIKYVLNECFKEEKINEKKLYINVVLTNAINIQKINKEQRQIDKATVDIIYKDVVKEMKKRLKERGEI